MPYTEAERETIGVCIAVEAINDMVNHALLSFSEIPELPGQAEVRFKSRAHQDVFLTRLLDFAKEGGDPGLTGIRGSCLAVLEHAARTRTFDRDGSVWLLAKATDRLRGWLTDETSAELWLPTLDINARLKVSRLEFLYIAGNTAKHNVARLTKVSREIAAMLKRNGYDVDLELIPLALDEFKDHLQEDYFSYYGTWLVELLNNVRWGIQHYLQPIYQWSFSQTLGELQYAYRYPDDIDSDIGRLWFWRLMTNVGRAPYLPRFEGAHYMKKEHLREW